jgi:DMSO/TMAO reductase YedYZ molybdopterin-dependent catalytic subunit
MAEPVAKEQMTSIALQGVRPMNSEFLAMIASRRSVTAAIGVAGMAALSAKAFAQDIDLGLPGGPAGRKITTGFSGKGPMILQRTRPPLLETPMEVFDGPGVITPNDRFFVRWHWADIPAAIQVSSFRLTVRGAVDRTLSLSLADILRDYPRVELTAINQCSGNSRGLFQPRVPGGQWAHGAMGNARWSGVRLRDILDKAGIKPGAVCVRFGGLDKPLGPDVDSFRKSLSVDHARNGEVMIAYAQNGEALPWLNGFPLRLVVPGWFSTYWVKMLNDIEVLDKPDDNYWMTKAYKLPDNPLADVRPGDTNIRTVPISTMVPRAWITNLVDGTVVRAGADIAVRGLAMGGTHGVTAVDLSTDNGRTWLPARLGPDEGRFSFRRFEARIVAPAGSALPVAVRATNRAGETQPLNQNWNPGGYRRAGVEIIHLTVAKGV